MARNSAIPPESFDEILSWLNPDRELAGKIYVEFCHDLTKIFARNRCSDPEGLTDEVFDRVARKVHDLRHTFVGNPKLYFYGVARNLIKEDPKKSKTQVPLQGTEPASNPMTDVQEETAAMREECLRNCLQKLSEDQRELIIAYYAKDKQAKIDHRTELAQRQGISVEALRVKVFRIRGKLEECIERCLDRMDQHK